MKRPADAIASFADRQSSVVRAMMRLIGRRLRAAHDSVKALSVDPVEVRLAATLLRLADGIELPFHLTRQNLADMSGITLETTIRVVSRWHRHALVEDLDGHLIVRNLDALRALAAGEAQ